MEDSEDLSLNSEVISFLDENKIMFHSNGSAQATPNFDKDDNRVDLSNPASNITVNDSSGAHTIDHSTHHTEAFIADHEKRLYQQISSQNLQIVEKSLSNSETVEYMQFEISPGVLKSLKILRITGDGNCLFGALSHQISGQKLNSRSHRNSTKQLRAQVVQHLKAHMDEFKPWIKGSIEEYSDSEEECTNFVKKYLPKSGNWGGSESIKAISDMHQLNIVIFCENDSFYFHHDYNPCFERCVAIAYRKYKDPKATVDRNHYDSIVEISPDDLTLCVKRLIEVHCRKKVNQNVSSIDLRD